MVAIGAWSRWLVLKRSAASQLFKSVFQPLIRPYRDGLRKSIPGQNDHYSDLMSTQRLSSPQLQGALDSRPGNEGGKRVIALIAGPRRPLPVYHSVNQIDPAVARSATRATGAAGSWTPAQRSAVIASFLAWVFDAFDSFLMVLCCTRWPQSSARQSRASPWPSF